MELRGRSIRINNDFLSVCDDTVAKNDKKKTYSQSQAVKAAANTLTNKAHSVVVSSVKSGRRNSYDGEEVSFKVRPVGYVMARIAGSAVPRERAMSPHCGIHRPITVRGLIWARLF